MTDLPDNDLTTASLPSTIEEKLALLDGELAMMLLTAAEPGPERFAAFHKLRSAARRDPRAAFNLGNYFADAPDPGRLRPRRRRLSLGSLHRTGRKARFGCNQLI